MICPNCGAQWQLPTTANIHIEKCPFCQGDMRVQDDTLNSLESVLKEIVSRFGTQILSDGQQLLSLFDALAPSLTKEKTMIEFFVACEGHIALSELQNASIAEQKVGCQKQIQKMLECITEVCNNYLAAIDVQYQLDNQEKAILEYEYADLGNNTVELTRCIGTLQEEMNFPSIIDGKKVVRISGDIFGTAPVKTSDRANVKAIIIPEGVTNIGTGAFHGCKSLRAVTLPQSLLRIDQYAFKSCKSLTSIKLPEGLTFVGKGLFSGSYITSIAIPEGVEAIPNEAFKNCKMLSRVSLPNTIKSIGAEAFSGCGSLMSISIPENVTTIEDRAFYECEKLINVELPDSIKSIGQRAFASCSLNEVKIPRGLTVITNIFEYCRPLTKVYIPEGVTTVESDAFYGCEHLHITMPKSISKIANDAFACCGRVTVQCHEGTLVHEYAKKKKWSIELI